LLRTVQATGKAEQARDAIAAALPAPIASSLRPSDYDALRERLMALPVPARPRVTSRDLRGAVEVFLLVFLSTFPVVLPFLVFSELRPALRASNAIAVIMLVLGGVSLGRFSGLRPWRLALALAGIGVVLVALTIALGG
jgi:VIT1/CCC1 family predicted Fe2+/Mn2+ transporter